MRLATRWEVMRVAFLRHEFWVLGTARSRPRHAILAFASLGVWVFFELPLFLAFWAITGLMTINGMAALWWASAALWVLFAVAYLYDFAPWLLRWSRVLVGLKAGRMEMAERKEADIRQQLEALAP